MTDQDKPAFTVVDKRRAAQKAASGPEPEGTAEASTASTAPIECPAATTQAPPTEGSSSEKQTPEQASGTDASAPPEEPQAPQEDLPALDPVMLLSLAAMQLDAPTFAHALLGVFDAYAWQAMGFVADAATGETHKDLPTAQLAIDCLQFLLGKVEAGLSEPERREVQRRLNDLRMNYLAKLRET
ncbi:MAG TPA: DUF1844 domain-containing protein [Chthonomonadaceae bacterium]|nr:DUF1844 domain-containing protein [Chthonomonadaceae bacterium]